MTVSLKAMDSWIIFDGDNTLWDVESLYDEARDYLCAFLEARGIDPSCSEEFQQRRDAYLHKTYGYSACRFARSFEDTLLHYFPDAEPTVVTRVRQLALAVFERQAELAVGLTSVLEQLGNEYRLGLITAGERWVQERRLAHFHLKDRFDVVSIVEAKDAWVLSDFCARNSVDVSSSWVVGDSLRSDILPAQQVGLNAVWLRTKNWAHIETNPHEAPADVREIRHLVELPAIILCS
jgi:putative hydrolase of the HAD superfamily